MNRSRLDRQKVFFDTEISKDFRVMTEQSTLTSAAIRG